MDKASKRAKKLERWRAKGRWHFILWHGVIGWGVVMAVLWSLATAWLIEDWEFLKLLVIALVVFPIGGYFFGACMWSSVGK